MSLLDLRKPKCVIIREGVSYSGKYKFFFGHHFPQGKICYDVGVVNKETGEITSRHYHDKSYPSPKAEALMYYDQISKKLQEKPLDEEADNNDARAGDAFRRALTGQKPFDPTKIN